MKMRVLGTARRAVLLPVVAILCAVVAAPAAAAPFHRADGDLSDWVGVPTMLSGETRLSAGELIYDDWLYDDYGANLDQISNPPAFRSNLAPTRGDYRYPTNAARYGYNAADIREVRVAADGTFLHILVYLQTMKARDAAAVTLAIDNPQNPQNTSVWPDGVGITGTAADHFVTSWGTGGWVTDAKGKRVAIARQATKLSDNAIEIDVAWNQLPGLRGKSATIYLASGLADPAAGRYLQVPPGQPTSTAPGGGAPGSTAAFDVAFDDEEVSTRIVGSHWGEEQQSQALAQANVSSFGRQVNFGQLEAGASDSYSPVLGRFYNRIFRSSQSYGEGIVLKNDASNPGGSPDPQFLSPYQPYGLYLPESYVAGTPAPLLLMGHSLDVNQNEYAVVSPNLYVQLGEQRSSIVITPLARGLDTWYINAGFKDVLEAWEDTKAGYTIDDDRTSISGYSMGGYMTYRMGLLMPDRFAAAASYVGPPAYQLWLPPDQPEPAGPFRFAGNTNHIVENGLDLPYEINNGAIDELVPAAGAQEQAKRFRDLGRPHTFYFYPTADHFALIGADEWGHTRDFLNDHPRRDLAPREVAYKRHPSMDLAQYGLRFDGAYWVDGMEVRTPGDACAAGNASCEQAFGLVEATTYARGGNRTVPEEFQSVYPGPALPAQVTGVRRVPGAPIAQQNGFEARLVNLSAISFDAARMGLDPNARITAQLTVEGAGQHRITLRGAFPPVDATVDGQPAQVAQTAEGVVVTATLSGNHQLVVTPR